MLSDRSPPATNASSVCVAMQRTFLNLFLIHQAVANSPIKANATNTQRKASKNGESSVVRGLMGHCFIVCESKVSSRSPEGAPAADHHHEDEAEDTHVQVLPR